MRLVLISDTHNLHKSLLVPEGDVLIHAGDITKWGDPADVNSLNKWFATLPHRHKLVIAGNHDFCLEQTPQESEALLTNCLYLRDASVTIEGVKFYGSPWQPEFCHLAFNLNRGPEIKAKWDLIPNDTDVLITHGPPYGFGDRTTQNEVVGCLDLMTRLRIVRPRLHVFGHIHEGYGLYHDEHTTYANASICTVSYQPINQPLVFDL
jgi:Icc-related predicted phosphoesterase